jgi:hypothetical protein
MGINNSYEVRALVAAAALEPQLGHLSPELYRALAPGVTAAKQALESLFREQGGYFIGDDVLFGMEAYRVDALVVKDGLVAVEMRKLKKDGTPSAKTTWEWLSPGLRPA